MRKIYIRKSTGARLALYVGVLASLAVLLLPLLVSAHPSYIVPPWGKCGEDHYLQGFPLPMCVHPTGLSQVIVGFLDEQASKAVAVLANILVKFLSTLITLAGSILDWAISPAIPYVKAPTPDWPVHTGWKLVRDFTNMGFVLGIVVIAISTILRFDSYGMKRLLWKLIMAAILVNFSLFIMGIILDPANLVMHFFVDEIKKLAGEGKPVSWVITSGAAGIANAEEMAKQFSEASSENATGSKMFRALVMAFFTILFLLILLIVLVALAIMMVVRHAVIWILAILAPAAFLLQVFPKTEEHWHRWWNTFIQWTLFGPAALFFVWLSTMIVSAMNSGPYFNVPSPEGLPGTVGQSMQLSMMYVLLVMMLMMSLTVAHQFGIHGAGAAMKIAQSVAGYPLKASAGIARARATRLAQRGTKTAERLGARLATAGGSNKAWALATRWTGLRAIGRGLLSQTTKAEAIRGKEMKEARTQADSLGRDTNQAFFADRGQGVTNRIAHLESFISKGGDVTRIPGFDRLIKELGIAAHSLGFRDSFRTIAAVDPRLFTPQSNNNQVVIEGISNLVDAVKMLKTTEIENIIFRVGTPGRPAEVDDDLIRAVNAAKGMAAFNRLANELSQTKLTAIAGRLEVLRHQDADIERLVLRLGRQDAWTNAGITPTPGTQQGTP
ncbi:MAG: hypothetical protein HYS57_01420 [Parcubacteria group bacterium]|nr:hypothetical protein [Parcubacteria group bacterium]